jgi:hypothetical protein
MPNQRAKNKLYLGGFVDKRLHALLLRKAKRAGMHDNKFGFVTELLQEAVKHRVARGNGKAVRAKD